MIFKAGFYILYLVYDILFFFKKGERKIESGTVVVLMRQYL